MHVSLDIKTSTKLRRRIRKKRILNKIRFMAVLVLVLRIGNDVVLTIPSGQCEDGELWVWKIANFHTHLKTNPALRFLPSLAKGVEKLQERIIEVADNIRKSEQKKNKKKEAVDQDKVKILFSCSEFIPGSPR